MTIKKTKILENALAKGFLLSYENDRLNPADAVFCTLLEGGDCHAAHILKIYLKDWELDHIKSKINAELPDERYNNPKSGVDVCKELLDALDDIGAEFHTVENHMMNTAHFLLYIIRDKSIVSSRILAMYNITPEMVAEKISEFPADEDYYTEMNALRNIRILHIGMQLPEKHDAGEDSDENDGETNEFSTDGDIKRAVKQKYGIERFCTDLTKAAANGEIDPVIGREKEIERLIQILGRRKKNNPAIIGEAGVGKSAIVEGLALKIVNREAPPVLHGKTIFSLDVAALVAGTKYRGQFEERIQEFINELKSNDNVILFIDEIHTMVGAGSSQGSLDTANILKPALARGELQCIGATTLDEYRENIEKDGALERRFQKIIVEPPSKEDTLKILNSLKDRYERHHSVKYSDEALKACVELADRYITDRNFPDKAIDILDEAGSKAGLSKVNESEALHELEAIILQVREEKKRAAANGDYDAVMRARVREAMAANRMDSLRSDWKRKRQTVGAEDIQAVVSEMTGIPAHSVSRDEKQKLRDMFSHLDAAVVGQQKAVSKITGSIQRSRAGLKEYGKPIGVFMFVGPTGVGKTLLAKELSKWLFDRGDAMIRIDMSEYSEKHNVSRLIGSPPGYVGYGEGGQLTEAVRRQPYAVVLFDEIEKAHPDVFNIMLQIFDEGHLTDGLGRKIDFRNTVIIMTSNAGARQIVSQPRSIGYGSSISTRIDPQDKNDAYRKALDGKFTPEFINRIDDIVIFNSLSAEDVKRIVDIELKRLRDRVMSMGYRISATIAARDKLAMLGFEPLYGVRSLKRVILEKVEEPLAEMIINEEINTGDRVEIGLLKDDIIVRKKKLKRLTSAKAG